MVIGTRSRFAVEFERNDPDQEVLESLYLWIHNEKFGGTEGWLSIRDVVFVMEKAMMDKDRRNDPDLFSLSGAEVFYRLHAALYENEIEWEAIASREEWARFQVAMSIGELGSYQIFLIENDLLRKGRIWIANVTSRDSDLEVKEHELSYGEFDHVLSLACEVLERLSK